MVKMERLRLAAFRGVPGELLLDFTSPLTIIYAPNGTGKSSVIDAAEWLLTGDVKRVSDFSKKSKASELRCKFSPAENRMEVEGWFLQDEEPFRLSRVPDAWLLYREGDEASHRTTSQKIMKLFAPQKIGKEKDYRSTSRLERDWILSARFLTVSTLELLVDTDSKNQPAREAALGGFLGVGELFARADKFESFARYLNDGYGGEEGLAATRNELIRRKEELARLRDKETGTGENLPELNELINNELSEVAPVLAMKEGSKQQTLLPGSFPEKRLAELKMTIGVNRQRLLDLKLAIKKLLELLWKIEGIETTVARAGQDQKAWSIKLHRLAKEIDELLLKGVQLDISLVKSDERLNGLLRKKSVYTGRIREILNSLENCEEKAGLNNQFAFEQICKSLSGGQKLIEFFTALDSLEPKRLVTSLEEVVRTIEEKISKIERKREQALDAARLFREKANQYCVEQLDRLFVVASPLFSRVQANEIFDSVQRGPLKNPFNWVAMSSSREFTPSPYFSMGQRQDLALAIFLARARGVKGTFFLDEPVIHLDDLNRVALMDTFRMLVLEREPLCNFVMTTARRDFVRHMAEKFANVPLIHGMTPLRIYELEGNPRAGVRVVREWNAGAG